MDKNIVSILILLYCIISIVLLIKFGLLELAIKLGLWLVLIELILKYISKIQNKK